MIPWPKLISGAAALVCGIWSYPGQAAQPAAPTAAPQLAQEFGGQSLVCDEIQQRYVVEQARLNSRMVNELFFDASARGCLDLVERFIGLGASLKARDRSGNTGLLLAAHSGKTKVVTWLLTKGSDLDHQNLVGSTALLRAVTMNRRRTTKALLEAGADPNKANRRGVAPLTAAAFNGNERLVKMLLEAGARQQGLDATGKTAMVYAAAKGFADVVALLLDAGAEIDGRYGNRLTALMWAAGHSNEVPVGEGLETVELLLSLGAGFDLTDDRGRTALMIAAERGHAEIVASLLAAGADPSARDKEGQSALDLASDTAVRQALGGG